MKDSIIRRGAMIGRFQPFHNGHLILVRQILKECNEVLIVVGSAQFNYTFTNPFTAGERILMTRMALVKGGLDVSKIFIIPLIDEEDNARWFSLLLSMLPPFDILYSGNNLVLALASPHKEVRTPRFIRKEQYNGSYIRKRILRGEEWNNLVSDAVFDFICGIDGINRVRLLAKHENVESSKSIDLQNGYYRKW